MQLRSAIALVPVAGIGMAVRAVSVGEYDWLFLAVAWSSTAAAGALLVHLTERALSTERLVTGSSSESEHLGGEAVFPFRVVRWFAAMWAVFFVAALWFGESLGVRGQVVLNLVVLFGGGSLLMLRTYRLDARRALALRMPRPGVWGAVLVGAPAGYVTAVGLSGLVDAYLFPMPSGTLEAFGEDLLGGLPLWQLVLFLAVMPAVLEEIAFRGVLLHGLRARMGPVATCLAVGAVFGLFHVALFRILPTAYLGVLLAATVLMTGSIYPAMLWHFLNNAIGLAPAQLGWVDETTEIPLWGFAAALAALVGALWAMRRAGQAPSSSQPT
jgi:sodium transport system permease protein